MLEELEKAYVAVFNDDVVRSVVRLYEVDGHQVAWMRCVLSLPDGGTSDPWHQLQCECEFTEGKGWQRQEDGTPVRLIRSARCSAVTSVEQARYEELHRAYKAAGKLDTVEGIEYVVLDLIAKVQAGEFLESGTGASFWGGFYYLQTLHQVVGDGARVLANAAVQSLEDKKVIQFTGNVLQSYREPPEPSWADPEHVCSGARHYVTASLPAHPRMEQSWKIQLFGSDSQPLGEPKLLPLTYAPTFGPDVDDVAAAQQAMQEMLAEAEKA